LPTKSVFAQHLFKSNGRINTLFIFTKGAAILKKQERWIQWHEGKFMDSLWQYPQHSGAKLGFLFACLRVIRGVEKSILRAGAGTGRDGREDGFSR
jgi:hypothetical protein